MCTNVKRFKLRLDIDVAHYFDEHLVANQIVEGMGSSSHATFIGSTSNIFRLITFGSTESKEPSTFLLLTATYLAKVIKIVC